uniref:Uncharacterized protein n=1 Tax=Anguilla anguilla TaxID=7936 RepID=A0A0E9SUV1_ANGAN
MTALNLRPTYITKHRVFSLVILCKACTTAIFSCCLF